MAYWGRKNKHKSTNELLIKAKEAAGTLHLCVCEDANSDMEAGKAGEYQGQSRSSSERLVSFSTVFVYYQVHVYQVLYVLIQFISILNKYFFL